MTPCGMSKHIFCPAVKCWLLRSFVYRYRPLLLHCASAILWVIPTTTTGKLENCCSSCRCFSPHTLSLSNSELWIYPPPCQSPQRSRAQTLLVPMLALALAAFVYKVIHFQSQTHHVSWVDPPRNIVAASMYLIFQCAVVEVSREV